MADETGSNTYTPLYVPTVSELRGWGSTELIRYLKAIYRRQIDSDVFERLEYRKLTGSWFPYMTEAEYRWWGVSEYQAKILVHEAKVIVRGRDMGGSDESLTSGREGKICPPSAIKPGLGLLIPFKQNLAQGARQGANFVVRICLYRDEFS